MGPFTDPVELDLFCNAWNVVAKFQESLAKYSHLLLIGIHRLVMTMSWVTYIFTARNEVGARLCFFRCV